MKISKKDAKLLLVLLGIVIFIAGYLGVYSRYVAKTEALQAQISELKPQLEQLREYDAKRAEYEASSKAAQDYVLEQTARYPTTVRQEDQLLYAISLRDQVGAKIGSVGFADPAAVTDLTGIRDNGGKSEFVPLSAYVSNMTVNCSLSYDQMKKLVDFLYATPACTTLESLSVSYDAETASLTGSVSVNQYSVRAADDPYVAAKVPGVTLGAPDPFGTLKPAASASGAAASSQQATPTP